MATRTIGTPVTRNEDARLLTGRALFIDDVKLGDMLHAAMLRSPLAHARIRSIDLTAARARDGVAAIITADDLGAPCHPGPVVWPPRPHNGVTSNPRTQAPLANQ